jgi:hypothetical protein
MPARPRHPFGAVFRNLRHSTPRLPRAPVFFSVAVISIGIGIGASTAIFSLLYQILLRSLPVAHPENVVSFHSEGPLGTGGSEGGHGETVFSFPAYETFRSHVQAFSRIAAFSDVDINAEFN